MTTKLSKNFALEEMTASEIAARRGIDNTPPPDVVEKLRRTATLLEEVRMLLGKPILITSGYRCPALNQAVGSKPTSAHLKGYAVDFFCPGFGTPLLVAKRILDSGIIKFDQLIHEHTWVHISFDPQMRQQPLTLLKNGDYAPGISEAH